MKSRVTQSAFRERGRVAPAGTSVVLRTVHLGPALKLALDERTQRVFIICTTCHPNNVGTLTTLDARSGAIVRSVTVGPFPLALAVDEQTGRVFAGDNDGVAMFDAGTGRLLRTIRLSGGANHMALAASAGHVFVNGITINNQYTAITMLDARSGTVLHETRLDGDWVVSAAADRAGRVVVTSFAVSYNPAQTTGTLRLLDARTDAVARTVRIGPEPYVVAVDESRNHVFIAEGDATTGSTVEMRDARSGALLHRTPINVNPTTMALDAPTHSLFVATLYTTDILDLRSGAEVHSVNTSTATTPVVLAPSGRMVLLAGSPQDSQGNVTGPGQLLVLDGHTGVVQKQVPVGPIQAGWAGYYDALVIDARTGRGFVLNGLGVTMFDATRL